MMRHLVSVAATMLCVAAASGCHERTGGSAVAETGVKWLDERHDPVKVTLALDTTNRVTRTVDSAGATITATGEDGTFFTLEIPRGALHARERISMIPVKRVEGLPLEQGGAVGTVQLEPEGLRFDRPVRLTIEVEKPVPANERLAFAWIADGRDTHLYPARGDSLEMHLQLLHFSGYGFGKAPPSDPGRIHLLYASAHEARLEAKLAEVIGKERKAILTGEDGSYDPAALGEAFRSTMIEYYDGIVAPTMKIAETDDRMAACALRFYLGWLRNLQLFSVVDETDVPMLGGDIASTSAAVKTTDPDLRTRMVQGSASAARIMANVAATMGKRAEDQCRQQHDLAAYVRVIAIYREFELLGGGPTTLPDLWKVIDKAEESCNRWEVELVSDVESRLPSGASRFQVASTAQYNGKDRGADAALNYQALEISGRPFKDVFDAMFAGNGGALLDARSPFSIADASLSKRGSRHGSVRVLHVEWANVARDTVGTSCAGRDEQQKTLVTDSVEVTLRIDPPTEIVRFTFAKGFPPPHDADMHEWMRFFTQFRQAAGDEIVAANGSSNEGQPEAQEQPQVLVVKVKQQEPGVWRAEFNTKEGVLGAKGLSETGHLVLRHTPQ
ncbi:MAG: hypothetical protein HOQ17_02505 [Gemmatimonadaceae bacterium]|nr:hypothetical protein [Gemmatimonadaceae bacterium]NUR32826.1 hypothetical protein [Gemmatimonadaceae bacterium]NUS31903.1 hypothetical protein [Gemmatimonadaceae bacterium]NUS47498.1 hypothetical protein [Gemmatimonadaceae bacterium]